MPTIAVDKDAFTTRIVRLFEFWISNPELFSDVDCISVPLGPDELMYAKSSSLYTWLFGYEVPDSVLVLCLDRRTVPPKCILHFLSGKHLHLLYLIFTLYPNRLKLLQACILYMSINFICFCILFSACCCYT